MGGVSGGWLSGLLGRLGLASPTHRAYTDATAFFEHSCASSLSPSTLPTNLSAAGASRSNVTKRGPERVFSDSVPGILPGSRFFRSPGARLSPDQWSHLLRMAWRVLRGEPPAGQLRPSRLLGTLGATSVLACPD
jgi:hypothetical protein